MNIDPRIASIIRDGAVRYGVDPNYLLQTAWIESRGNPNAKNPGSSAEGLFQFIDSTANQYGLQNRRDAGASSDAAARLTRDNERLLERALGRKPTSGEKYLAHQQGAGGALKLLQNPNALASSLVGTDAVRLNGGRPNMTASEFASLWTRKFPDNTSTAMDDNMGGFTPQLKNFAKGINQGANPDLMQQQMPQGQEPQSVLAQWQGGDRAGAMGRGTGALGRMIEQLSSNQQASPPPMLQAPQARANPLMPVAQSQQPSSISQLLAALGQR